MWFWFFKLEFDLNELIVYFSVYMLFKKQFCFYNDWTKSDFNIFKITLQHPPLASIKACSVLLVHTVHTAEPSVWNTLHTAINMKTGETHNSCTQDCTTWVARWGAENIIVCAPSRNFSVFPLLEGACKLDPCIFD